MKSERRHELKTNELAEWLSHLPELLGENYIAIICITVVVIVVAGVAYAILYRERAEVIERRIELTELSSQVAKNKIDTVVGAGQGRDFSTRLLMTADALDNASRRLDNPVYAALALNKRAESLRTELHYRPESLESGATKAQINQAVKSYEQALAKNQENAAMRAMAEFGLGLCAEELGDLARAKSIYRGIVANPDYQGMVFVPQAQERLETMQQYSGNIYFSKAASAKPGWADEIDMRHVEEAFEVPAPNVNSVPFPVDINEITR
jgi:tetratricopeptide (TPR) repeat protein